MFFSTDNRYSYGYQLCSFSRLLVHLFVWCRFHEGGLLKKNDELARSLHISLRYIGDVVSLDYSRFGYFVYRIYLIVLEIKNTIDTARSAPCLDLHLEIDSEG